MNKIFLNGKQKKGEGTRVRQEKGGKRKREKGKGKGLRMPEQMMEARAKKKEHKTHKMIYHKPKQKKNEKKKIHATHKFHTRIPG